MLNKNTEVNPGVVTWLKDYHRVANYLGAAQLYLRDNYDLGRELVQEDIKERILGHWGTVPGINLMYAASSWAVRKYRLNAIFVAGSGHGAPAVIANLFLEGSLQEFYPEYTRNIQGMGRLIHDFSWPDKFPSHSGPNLPGTLHEGGELGYSLGTAVGAVLDNPELTVFVQIGDGEAETGPLVASWQSSRYLNPESDGAVIPILHLNGYKISNPTLLATMSDEELEKYFTALGWQPLFVNQSTSPDVYVDYLEATSKAVEIVQDLQFSWRNSGEQVRPRWPLIVFRSAKGWTGPAEIAGKKLEDNCYSHGIPLTNPRQNELEFTKLKTWLESYRIQEFLGDDTFDSELFRFNPEGERRMGVNQAALGQPSRELELIELEEVEQQFGRRGEFGNSMRALGEYMRRVTEKNRRLRLFSPDETESNKIDAVFGATHKQFLGPTRSQDNFYAREGQVLEILSEHVLQAWMTGYLLTGRHAWLVSYEAFLSIIVSQIDQHIKFLKKSREYSWRKSVPSATYISTSTAWIQEHNGFSHQNPALLSTLLSKQDDIVNIYFPADANTALVTMERCLQSRDGVNLITASKRPLAQWLTLEEARRQVAKGASVWEFASTDKGREPDVVLCGIGDTQMQEVMAAVRLLKDLLPILKIRVVNVSELTALGLGVKEDLIDTVTEFNELFTLDKPVIINYHGYPQNIRQLLFQTPVAARVTIRGYVEQGTTTTTFDMQVKNKTSRFDLAIEAIEQVSIRRQAVAEKGGEVISYLQEMLGRHRSYIQEHGDDMAEIKSWKW